MRIVRRLYIIIYAAAALPLATSAHAAGGAEAQGDSCVRLRLYSLTPLPVGERHAEKFVVE